MSLGPREEKSALFAIVLIRALVLVPYLNVVPFWDGSLYFSQAVRAVAAKFDFFRYSLIYISPIYTFILAFPQNFDFTNSALAVLAQILIHLASIPAFFVILRSLDRRRGTAATRLLCTMCYAFVPISSAGAILPNPDLSVLTFFLIYLAAIFRRRYLIVCLAGLGMAFSKQPGFAIYSLGLPLLYYIFHHRRIPVPHAQRMRNYLLLAIPPLAYLLAVYAHRLGNRYTHWTYVTKRIGFATMALDYNLISPLKLRYLSFVFLMNFSWCTTVILFLALLKAAYRRIGTKSPAALAIDRRQITLLACFLLISLYVVTRYTVWTHPRHVLSAIGPLYLLLYPASVYLIHAPRRRHFVLGALFLTLFFSNFRTLDPVSLRYYRNMAFGEHRMLFTRVQEGSDFYICDEMAYNLEVMNLHYLHNEFTKDIKVNPRSAVLANPRACTFGFPLRIDRQTFERTGRRSNSFLMRYRHPSQIGVSAERGENLHFLALPNVQNRYILSQLNGPYRLESVAEYWRDGYSIKGYFFTPRRRDRRDSTMLE